MPTPTCPPRARWFAKADAAHHRATKRVARRPSHETEGFFLSATTQIPPDKLRAYQATEYRLGHTSADIVLRIGERSQRLAELFTRRGVTCGAFITAYNPQGTQQSAELNAAAHAELIRAISVHDLETIEGAGSEPGTDWEAELSLFALGLELEPASEIGIKFGQDAIVWAGSDAIPQLILLS